jgi:hypothetical protein
MVVAAQMPLFRPLGRIHLVHPARRIVTATENLPDDTICLPGRNVATSVAAGSSRPEAAEVPAAPSREILEFLRSLPPGTIVAQLDNGELAVCADLEEAEERFAETSQSRADRGWQRIAATLPG